MRIAISLVVLLLAVTAVAVGRSAPAPAASSAPTVPCADAIMTTKFPYATGGYRLVLGAVSVPPAYLQQVVPSGSRPWTYWRKAGLVVRAGSAAVSVSVPPAWRTRAAITWGNNTGIVSSLRIAACPSRPDTGNAYAGGFYLRSPSTCVPLVFRVGRRSATVRFGVGRRCSASSFRSTAALARERTTSAASPKGARAALDER